MTTQTFTCIICLRDLAIAEQTVEHIFPYAIGGMLVLPEMCKPCNDRLGKYVDAGLVHHQSIRFPRRNLGLLGRSRQEVTPLVGRTIDDPTGRPRRAIAKPTGGYYYHPHHVRTENGLEIHVDPMDAARLPSLVARAERSGRAGKVEGIVETPKALVELDLTLHDQRWVRGLVKIAYELAYRALGRQYMRDPTAEILRGMLRSELEG